MTNEMMGEKNYLVLNHRDTGDYRLNFKNGVEIFWQVKGRTMKIFWWPKEKKKNVEKLTAYACK